MFRRAFAAPSVATLTAALLVVPPALAAPPTVPDHIQGYTILPPGADTSLAHTADQVAMYAALADDPEVSVDELGDYFHSFAFGPDTIEREYMPPGRTDVTIYRDSLGVPHVYSDSDAGAAYALGYVSAEDRLWQMDVLRHAGLGRLSEFLGASTTTFDRVTRRDTYSTEQLTKMLNRLDDRFGSDGALVQEMLQAYSDGVNARLAEIDSGAITKPIEYFVQRVEPETWHPIDSLAAAILQIRAFGSGGGQEMENAAALHALQEALGNDLGRGVFDDLYYRNDPDAPTSIPDSVGAFPSQDLGPVDAKAVAIPDDPAKVVARIRAGRRAVERTLTRYGLSSPASHFVAVDPARSETGNPLQWGGPQVGYSVPGPFMEIDVHSPSIDSRGMALPGAAIIPAVGRTSDRAWSITTGTSDLVDTFVEKLCHPTKKTVPNRSKYYKHNGKCKKMTKRTESFDVKNEPSFSKNFFRTKHGAVVAWAKLDSKPVAITQLRSYHKGEVDFILAIARINLKTTDSIEEFGEALSIAPLSFNMIYTDATDIGYFHAGRYPVRAGGVDPKLPVWGKGGYDWQGFMPWEDHPQMVNPPQGWIANWNNKPSTGWDSSDASNWGPTQRVRLLSEQLDSALSGGTMSLTDLVNVIRDAATQDSNAVRLAERTLAEVTPAAGTEQDAFDALQVWIDAGAHRQDVDRDSLQDSGAGVALWDTFYDNLVHGVFDDELGGLYEVLRIDIADDAPHSNGSSYFFDYSNYLWHLFGGDQARYARDYCDDLGAGGQTCSDVIQTAFSEAVAALEDDQGSTVADWTWPADHITFSELGAQSVDPIPWQNRGTYNHAVEVTGP